MHDDASLPEHDFPRAREVARSPLSLRMARSLWRSGYRRAPGIVLGLALRLGRLRRLVRHPLGRGVTVVVPAWRNPWDEVDVRDYEHELIDTFVEEIGRAGMATTVVDIGADIGLVSSLVAARSPHVTSIVALEPNPESYPYLQRNLNGVGDVLGIETQAINTAAGAATGYGTLRSPDYDPTHHAWYIEMDADGTIPVTCLDDLDLPAGACLAMKIDVEGTEGAVLAGAAATLRRFEHVIVAFEAQRHAVERAGMDPTGVLRGLGEYGLAGARVVEHPDLDLDLDRPFFEQVDGANVFNVVATLSPTVHLDDAAA